MGGDLEPGATLPNAASLARELKMSRPSLREAIKTLAAKGLLSASPRRGTIVRPRSDWNRLDQDVLAWEAEVAPTQQFIRDLFELRRMVEPEAASLASVRATDEGLVEIAAALDRMTRSGVISEESIAADLAFHRAILIHSCNEFLATFAPAIEASLRVTFEAQRSASPTSAHFVPPHQAIFDAIQGRQPELAKYRTIEHLTRAETDALHALGNTDTASAEANLLDRPSEAVAHV